MPRITHGPQAISPVRAVRYLDGVAEPVTVRDLIASLEQLDAVSGVERARLASQIQTSVEAILAAEYDHGVWQATRPGVGTRKQTAEALGTTVAYVQKRSSQHSKRRSGRKADRKGSD